ncbi:MAG: hypothetical protein HYU67_11025 [Flavobacteriia bacterium]|nr:hypothetical protein [Flavobacteriia bacterium]
MSRPIVDKKDRNKGIISAFFAIVLIFFYLKWFTFILADPPPKDIPLIATIETSIEIPLKVNNIISGGGGSGTPVEAPIKNQNTPQTEKVITKKESSSETKTGESTLSTKDLNQKNESSTTKSAPNPFGNGGSGGGTNGGNGNGFGADNGEGSGSGGGKGNGSGDKARIRLNDPNTEGIFSDYNCKISLKLTINAEGDIIKAENIVAKTTTTNQIVINQVIANVKSQVKYNKKIGSIPEIVYLTINLSAK